MVNNHHKKQRIKRHDERHVPNRISPHKGSKHAKRARSGESKLLPRPKGSSESGSAAKSAESWRSPRASPGISSLLKSVATLEGRGASTAPLLTALGVAVAAAAVAARRSRARGVRAPRPMLDDAAGRRRRGLLVHRRKSVQPCPRARGRARRRRRPGLARRAQRRRAAAAQAPGLDIPRLVGI